jgi:hypothetical protein
MLGTVFLLAGMSLPLGADESASETMDEALGGTSKQGCFFTRDASDFDVLDRSNLIVYAPTKSRAYHVRIAPPSNELRFANGLMFEGRDNRICGYAGESLSFRGGEAGRRYSITNVWQLDASAREQLLGAYKTGAGKKIPEAKESHGADIERDLTGIDGT